jgi:hypothetical protein
MGAHKVHSEHASSFDDDVSASSLPPGCSLIRLALQIINRLLLMALAPLSCRAAVLDFHTQIIHRAGGYRMREREGV